MTATAHALIGAAIATKFTNPVLGIPLSFASHFLLDKIPHWDVMTNDETKSHNRIVLESAADVILSSILVTIFLVIYLMTRQPNSSLALTDIALATNPLFVFNIYLCAFAAQLPDWLEIPETIFHIKFKLFHLNYLFQKWIHDIWFDSRLKAPLGVITQITVTGAFLVWSLI